MKNYLLSAGLLTSLSIAVQAGAPLAPVATPDAFSNAITPISNPTLHGNPLPKTNVHAMFMHQRLSDGSVWQTEQPKPHWEAISISLLFN